jgi:hypothetical protein
MVRGHEFPFLILHFGADAVGQKAPPFKFNRGAEEVQ